MQPRLMHRAPRVYTSFGPDPQQIGSQRTIFDYICGPFSRIPVQLSGRPSIVKLQALATADFRYCLDTRVTRPTATTTDAGGHVSPIDTPRNCRQCHDSGQIGKDQAHSRMSREKTRQTTRWVLEDPLGARICSTDNRDITSPILIDERATARGDYPVSRRDAENRIRRLRGFGRKYRSQHTAGLPSQRIGPESPLCCNL